MPLNSNQTKAMNTELIEEEVDIEELTRRRVAFAKAWMQRKRAEQEQMREEAKTDPVVIAAFEELRRQNKERGTCIVQL